MKTEKAYFVFGRVEEAVAAAVFLGFAVPPEAWVCTAPGEGDRVWVPESGIPEGSRPAIQAWLKPVRRIMNRPAEYRSASTTDLLAAAPARIDRLRLLRSAAGSGRKFLLEAHSPAKTVRLLEMLAAWPDLGIEARPAKDGKISPDNPWIWKVSGGVPLRTLESADAAWWGPLGLQPMDVYLEWPFWTRPPAVRMASPSIARVPGTPLLSFRTQSLRYLDGTDSGIAFKEWTQVARVKARRMSTGVLA